MFLLGHLGIGSKLVSPWTGGLRKRDVFFGTILPDLIDKPLYYGLVIITGKKASELGIISGSRTFGHTALLLVILVLLAAIRKSRLGAGVALGMMTHLLLDNLGDHLGPHALNYRISPLLWPLTGWSFPLIPFESWKEHIWTIKSPFILWAEVIGLLLLLWDYWQTKNRVDIIERFQIYRARRKHGLRTR